MTGAPVRLRAASLAAFALIMAGAMLFAHRTVQAAPVAGDVRDVFVTFDENTWRLEIPFQGRWSHWAMNNPPRIVVDLIGATSRLPNAPELYELKLPDGPVQTLQTRQQSSDPGNRRMRITLILAEPVRYEVGKCEGGIDIRIPRPPRAVWGERWELDLDSEGVNRQVVGRAAVTPERCDVETFDSAAVPGDAQPQEVVVLSAPAEGDVPAKRRLEQQTPPAAAAQATTGRQLVVDREQPAAEDGQPEAAPGQSGTTARQPKAASGLPKAASGQPAAPEPAEERRRRLEVTLRNILADTTFFETDPPSALRSRQLAWNTAAGRLVEEAQSLLLEGDTASCMQRLTACERFYPQTIPGRQAALLRYLLLRVWGRFVEADLGPPPPKEGHWPLLYDPVFERMHEEAIAKKDLSLSGEVLEAWKQADPDTLQWAQAALRQAEAHLDAKEGERAAKWVTEAIAADPELQASPRARLNLAMAMVVEGRLDEAEGMLRTAEAAGDSSVAYRARAARADIYYRQHRYQEAADVYKLLARWEVPAVNREWALYQLGNCWSLLGDRAKARSYYTVAIEASPKGFWTQFAQIRLAELEAQGRGPARR